MFKKYHLIYCMTIVQTDSVKKVSIDTKIAKSVED